MAGRAPDPLVVSHKAFAVGQPVRLEPDVPGTENALAHNRLPGPVALAAEVRHVFRGHIAEPRGRGRRFAQLHRAQMRFGSRMAMFALHAGRQRFQG
jgi:hypothetical protein